MKVLVKAVLICLLLVVVVGGVGFFLMNRYLRSPEFAQDLSRMASEKVDGDLTFSDLQIDGMTARSSAIQLKNSGKIQEISIKGFATEFGRWNIFQRSWMMERMDCNQLHVHIRRRPRSLARKNAPSSIIIDRPSSQPPRVQAARPAPPQPTPSAPSHQPAQQEAFYKRWLPQEVAFDRIRVDQFSGLVERRKDPVSWTGVSMEGEFQADTLRLDLRGGTLFLPTPILQEWTLSKATVIATEETYEVRKGAFRFPGGGEATLEGNGQMSGGDLSMTLDLHSVPVSSLLPTQHKNATLSGLVDGRVFAVSQDDETVTKGSITLNQGILELPSVMKHVLPYIALDGSSKLLLDQCSCNVINVADTTILENLQLSVGNAYKVHGLGRLDGDTYSIDCRLGVSAQVIDKFPKGLRQSFQLDGTHYWIPVSATGHKDQIAQDLGLKAVTALTASYLTDDNVIQKVDKALGTDILRYLGEDADEKLKKAEESIKKKGLDLLKKLF